MTRRALGDLLVLVWAFSVIVFILGEWYGVW